jgi:uncharacterized integral membrane protein
MAKMPPHSKPIEFIYRSGYPLQALGFLVLLASSNPSSFKFAATIVGYILIDAGILISAILLQVYMARIKHIVLSGLIVGIILQLAGVFSGISFFIPLGLGVAFIGAAGLGGKEAYCFSLKEGYLMTPILAVLAILLVLQVFLPYIVIFVRLVVLVTVLNHLSFSIRKYRKPYLGGCEKI